MLFRRNKQETKFSVPNNLYIGQDAKNRTKKIKKAQKDSILAILTMVVLVAVSVAGVQLATADHVAPQPISSGNPSCADFGAGWSELKLEGAGEMSTGGTDGTLTVVISNFVQSSSGTPGSFDWSSNIGVDAVFVKAGNDKHNLYAYSPKETLDTGLNPQAGSGNGISHISFCYNVDDDPDPTLTLVKTVVNDDGGTLGINDFQAKIDGTDVAWNTAIPLDAGNHTASEVLVGNYTAGDWGGDCDEDGNITLSPGENAECTITNNDIAITGTLTLVKTVTNDNGGSAIASDFQAYIDGNTTDWNIATTLTAGDYVVSEDTVAGYEAGDWGGDCDEDGNVTIVAGNDYECTITNDDQPASITVTKEVTNDNGGTADVDDFELYVDATLVANGVSTEFAPGSYTVSEIMNVDGYSQTSIACDGDDTGTLNLALGEHVDCTIANNDIAPKLTVVKQVINNNGGSAIVSDFTLYIDGNEVTSGAVSTLGVGTYAVSEDNLSGYGQTSAVCNNQDDISAVSLELGDDVTCTIVNDDIAPTLTLVKTVVNDDGGTLGINDFQAKIDGTDVAWNTAIPLDAGNHTASEVLVGNYTAGDWGGDCDEDGNITLSPGENAECTITNNDIAPTLTLVKTVINDNGRNATEADFQGQIDGTDVPWDVAQILAPGTYTVSEDNVSGYNLVSITCDNGDTGGPVTVNTGDQVTCTFLNDDVPTTSGGSPVLTIEKSVTPTITDPGTTVEYVIVVRNVGSSTAINVTLTDDLPDGFTYADTGLDTRSWTLGNMAPGASQTVAHVVDVGPDVLPGNYVNVAETQANNHGSVSDDATVTVRGVLGEEAEPVLQITKVGDREIINPGGQINYTITITNVGEAPAINLVVTDTLPEGFTSADTGLGVITWDVARLDVGDTWDVSFLVNVSEDIETQPLDEDVEGEQETGTYINEVRANAENYDGELFASYTVAARGEVLGETGAGISDIAMWFLAILTLVGSGLLFKRELSLARN